MLTQQPQQTTSLFMRFIHQRMYWLVILIAALVQKQWAVEGLGMTQCHHHPPPHYKLPPGKAKWPIFGDTFQLINAKTMGSYQVESRNRFGSIWKTNLFFTPAVFVTGNDNLKDIFGEEAKKKTSAFFPPHHRLLFGSNSLLVQSGPYHAKLRRCIQQALSPQQVSSMEPLILAEVQEFIKECKQSKETFKFVDKIRVFFIKLAVKVLLGNDISDPDVKSLASDISLWSNGLVSAPLTFIPWSTASRALRARKRVASRLGKIIELDRLESSSSAVDKNSSNLLSRLVTTKDEVDGEYLSVEAIVDNVFTLIFAGSDTTASSMTSALKTLSLNTDLQQRLRRGVTSTESEDLTNLDDFISDVLAKNPPAPFSMRLVGDQPLRVSDFEVPPNWLVAYGYSGTLIGEGESKSKKPEAHIAFGGGPRMCPGRYLALLELRILLAHLLGREGFNWSLEADQVLVQEYTPGFFPVDGLQIKIV